MSKNVCKILHLNSKGLLRKLQKMLGGYFILPHPVLFILVVHEMEVIDDRFHVITSVRLLGLKKPNWRSCV